MNTTMIVLRLLHIGVGVFWAGAILFVGLFLEPSIRAAGPAGGQVMQQMQARRYGVIMPLAALIAILTGFELLRRDFPGGPSAWVATGGGTVFVIGGSAALLTLIIGFTVTLPTIKRMQQLAGQLAAQGSQPDPALAEQVVALRKRFTMLARFGVLLVSITVVCMAIARYVG